MRRKRFPMIWNKPGGQDNGNNPWNRKNNDAGPPDLDKIFQQFLKKIQSFAGKSSGSSGSSQEFPAYGIVFLCIVAVIYVISGIYIVEPPERAVIMRFGQYARTVGPGPHWLPPLIESREIVNVEQVATSDHNGLMLTRDGNIVSVGVAVQYRVGDKNEDVRSYLFNVVNPIRSLHQSAESALRQVVGQSTMDEVLTLKRAEIATAIKDQTIATIKNYNTGIWVLDVVMQFAKAPDEVRAAFDEVIKASADEERLVNQARAYENEILPKAKGIAERLKNEALAYKQEAILVAEGKVQRFNLVLPQYLKAPKVMQTRMYLDAIEQILSKTSKIVVDPGIGNSMVYLPLDQLLAGKLEEEKDKATTTPDPVGSGSSSNEAKVLAPLVIQNQQETNS